MPSLDNDIKWRRKREFIKASEFMMYSLSGTHTHSFLAVTGIVDDTTTRLNTAAGPPVKIGQSAAAVTALGGADGGVQSKALGILARSPGVGNPNMTPVTGTTLAALQMEDVGDEALAFLMLPFDLDPRQTIGFKVHYAHGSATATDTVKWRLRYSIRNENAVLATPTTALDTILALQTLTAAAAGQLKITSRGIINANTLGFAGDAVTPVGLGISVELNSADVDLAAEGIWLLGVEFDYWPTRCQNALDLRGNHPYADP